MSPTAVSSSASKHISTRSIPRDLESIFFKEGGNVYMPVIG